MRLSVSSAAGMARHIDISDKAATLEGKQAPVRRNWFINPDEHGGLAAYRIEVPMPGTVVAPHFHMQDQFQVFVHGAGSRIGNEPLQPLAVHYAEAFSPYGPIVAGPNGVAWFVFRLQRDEGAFRMPESRGQMTRKPGRNVTAGMPPESDTFPSNGV